MKKIKAFLQSLAGKGWLWGTGKEITVNHEHTPLQENKPPYGFVRTDAMSEVLKKAEEGRFKEAANPVLERWATTTDPHDKEELTEIDFMCAWLHTTGLLPHDCDIVFKKDYDYGFDRIESTCDNHLHQFPTIVIYIKPTSKYLREYAHINSVSEFIYKHGIENLEWMFKSVTYDV